jgi:hypothetical protein
MREEMTVQHIHSKCRQPRRGEMMRKINNCVESCPWRNNWRSLGTGTAPTFITSFLFFLKSSVSDPDPDPSF